ncbi:MAG: metallopeptidase TldD-related protein [Alphaproteobacteria bacterium]|nr:metallopeptidase TldD-related protein [Alphaproteobacteria bacterium]
MSDVRSITDRFFFGATGMDPDRVTDIVTSTLRRADGGELFLQRSMSKSASFGDGRLQSAGESLDQGFGFRFISGESVGYAHSQDLSERTIRSLGSSTKEIRKHADTTLGFMTLPSGVTVPRLYAIDNPLLDISDADRIKILEDVNARARSADPRIIQVTAGVSTGWNVITIIRKDGERFDDVRPMSQLYVEVVAEEAGRKKKGMSILSGRMSLSDVFTHNSWQGAVDNAVRKAIVNLGAIPAPAGEMPVVLANGWAAVMLHESVGHGLEGDAARKNASVYANKIGERVASKGVTIIDQGNIPGARGSLHFDDEGNPTKKNILIEDGILQGYMQDSINARLMGVAPTGNGRRESYQHAPIPRMTTTYMAAGEYTPEEIIASVDRGIYAVDFAGGQVDTVSGSYVFAPTEAYLIENGKIVAPVENAILTGNGPRSMQMVDMVGNDLELSLTGSCGKDGQSVSVGVGQPTVKMRGIKVGGTQPS